MKIFIAHSWSDVGVNIQTKAVATKLSERNEVLFFSQSRIGMAEKKISDSLTVLEWPNKRPNKVADLLFICKKIFKEKPTVIIAHFGATNICMIASWLMGVKYRICWLHTLTEQYHTGNIDQRKERKLIRRRKWVYAMTTHIVVLNQYGRRDAICNYHIPSRKIKKIFNGINPCKVEPVQETTLKSVRFIGRLDFDKGVDLLIRAVSRIRIPDRSVIFEIAGKGGEEDHLRAMVKQLTLDDKVRFRGYFSHYTEATQFIAEAYCLVVPSRMDNFPTVILEAMSAGVPVIAFAAGGIPEMIEDGKDGLLVPAEDEEALRGAISSLLADESLRERMSANAKANFGAKFSMQRHVQAVEAFINHLV